MTTTRSRTRPSPSCSARWSSRRSTPIGPLRTAGRGRARELHHAQHEPPGLAFDAVGLDERASRSSHSRRSWMSVRRLFYTAGTSAAAGGALPPALSQPAAARAAAAHHHHHHHHQDGAAEGGRTRRRVVSREGMPAAAPSAPSTGALSLGGAWRGVTPSGQMMSSPGNVDRRMRQSKRPPREACRIVGVVEHRRWAEGGGRK